MVANLVILRGNLHPVLSNPEPELLFPMIHRLPFQAAPDLPGSGFSADSGPGCQEKFTYSKTEPTFWMVKQSFEMSGLPQTTTSGIAGEGQIRPAQCARWGPSSKHSSFEKWPSTFFKHGRGKTRETLGDIIGTQWKRIWLASTRMQVWSLASLSGLRIRRCRSCGVGHRCGLEPILLWLWCRPVATALIPPLAWEPPYASGAALKKKEREKLYNGEIRQIP